MINIPFVWAWKLGITGDLSKRLAQNSRNVWGVYLTVAAVKIHFAWQIEQKLLKATRWAKTSVFGTGGREVRNIIAGIPLALIVWLMIAVKHIILVVAFIGLIYLLSHQ